MKHYKEKIISFAISATLVMGMSAVSVSAETRDEYEYTVENGNATITKYNGNLENVTIPAKIDGYNVKTVAFDAFMNDNSKNIKNVVVSEGIEYVGNWLFTYSKSLETITFPSTITSFATDRFFIGSPELKEIKFSGDNPRYYIDNGALYDSEKKQIMLCPAKREYENGIFKIADGTANISGYAFDGCNSLKKVIMPNSVSAIGDHAFSGCKNISELVVSENISSMTFDSLGGMASLKSITIPKNVKGFYYNGKDVFTYLGYVGSEKIDGFTIKGYRNTEAEKYANDNGFKFIALDDIVDYSKYNPFEFLGMTMNDIADIFGNDYEQVTETESGLTKFYMYKNTDNPFEFGVDYDTQRIKYVYVYDFSDKPIGLFDDITNKSILADFENSSTKYKYTKNVFNNPFNYNIPEQHIYFTLDNGASVHFLWTTNDFDNQSANRVQITGGQVQPTTKPSSTTSTTQSATISGGNVKPTTSTSATSNISATKSSTTDTAVKGNTTDNGVIKTGSSPVMIIIILTVIVLAGIGGFVFYKRKAK